MSVVGGLHETGIEIFCTGGTKMPHDERHVASVLEVLGRSPVGPGVERTRRGYRLKCGWRDEHRRCREDRPLRESHWLQLVAKMDADGVRRFDISGMR